MGTPVTKEGHARLTEELEHLKAVERPAIIEAIATARAHGDLKENAEYHSAKEKQGFIEARIKMLDSALSSADIIDAAAMNMQDKCIFGAYVRLGDEDGKETVYRLVGELEANIDEGRISTTSPIGRALIGKFAGDAVTINTPGGEIDYELLEVAYQPFDQ